MKKTLLDPQRLEYAASKLRAISHPMRITIIHMLDENKQMNVTSIHSRLNIEQAAASHHLNILKSKGIVESRRDGKNTIYSLRPEAMAKLIECVQKCGE